MKKESILKIFGIIALVIIVAGGISFSFSQRDKNIPMTQPSVVVPPETTHVYTEVEKVKILQNLALREPSTTTPQISSSTVSAQETQKRMQILKKVAASFSTTSPSDAEKLRILNSFSSK